MLALSHHPSHDYHMTYDRKFWKNVFEEELYFHNACNSLLELCTSARPISKHKLSRPVLHVEALSTDAVQVISILNAMGGLVSVMHTLTRSTGHTRGQRLCEVSRTGLWQCSARESRCMAIQRLRE